MAIDLSTNPGGLFVRFGKLIGGANESCVALNTTLRARADTVAAQYALAQQDVIGNLYADRNAAFGAMSSWIGQIQGFLTETMIQMAFDDGTGINPLTLNQALDKLITQMIATAQSINRPVISATVTADAGNTGTGTIIASLVNPVTGNPTDMVFAETLTALCTDDAYPGGGATSGQEPFTITGQIAAESALAVDWPLGSGASATDSAQDPSATGQIITDGDFEEWGGSGNNTPTNWSINLATLGTTLIRGTSAYTGSYDMEFIGNGSQLTSIQQALTFSDFEPATSYGFLIWMKTDGSVAAGAGAISLVDESGTVINDELGTANTITFNVTTLTSSYTAVSGFFRMPKIITATEINLRIALTTAITNTEVLHMDSVGIQQAVPLYDGGPLIAIFRGAVPFAINDLFTIAIANNLTITSFVRSLDRFFDLRVSNKEIPSAVSETLSDALIS